MVRILAKLCHNDILSTASKYDITESQLSLPACVQHCIWAAFSSAVFSGKLFSSKVTDWGCDWRGSRPDEVSDASRRGF